MSLDTDRTNVPPQTQLHRLSQPHGPHLAFLFLSKKLFPRERLCHCWVAVDTDGAVVTWGLWELVVTGLISRPLGNKMLPISLESPCSKVVK